MQGDACDVVMLGLAGFVVLGVTEADGKLEVTEKTTAVRVGCSQCGVVARSHGQHDVPVREVHAFDTGEPSSFHGPRGHLLMETVTKAATVT